MKGRHSYSAINVFRTRHTAAIEITKTQYSVLIDPTTSSIVSFQYCVRSVCVHWIISICHAKSDVPTAGKSPGRARCLIPGGSLFSPWLIVPATAPYAKYYILSASLFSSDSPLAIPESTPQQQIGPLTTFLADRRCNPHISPYGDKPLYLSNSHDILISCRK